MKKLLLFIVILLNFGNAALAASPNNQAIAYFNSGVMSSRNHNYAQAISSYKKAIATSPQFYDAYFNIAVTYQLANNYAQSIIWAKKLIAVNPSYTKAKNLLWQSYFNLGIQNQKQGKFESAVQAFQNALKLKATDEETLFCIGYNYSKLDKHDKAISYYKKVLNINPDNKDAKNNLEISSRLYSDNDLKKRILQTVPVQQAPNELAKLIKTEKGVDSNSVNQLRYMIDLMWGDREGRILLSTIAKNKIPIVITKGKSNTNALIQSHTRQQTIALYGIIPIYTFATEEEKNISINIGEEHINDFYNESLSGSELFYAFQVLGHELCHSAKGAISKGVDNSMQEEISASMIGYNAGSRIFRGRDLTRDEAYEYSKKCLKGVLMDDHRNLPLYNNFISQISQLGLYPPYPDFYQNIPELYKAIRNDSDTQKLQKLEALISQ